MFAEDVHSHQSLVELGISRLHQFVVSMFLKQQAVQSFCSRWTYFVVHCLQAFNDKLEQSLQVFWSRAGHENVRVSKSDCSGNCETQCGGLSSASSCGDSAGGFQRLLGNHIQKPEYCLKGYDVILSPEKVGLPLLGTPSCNASVSPRWASYPTSHSAGSAAPPRVVILRATSEQLRALPFCSRVQLTYLNTGRYGFDVQNVCRNRQDVQLVVNHQARLAAGQRKDEALIEAWHNVAVRLGSEPAVHVLDHLLNH